MENKIDDTLLSSFLEISINPRSLSGDTVLHMAAKHEKWQLVRRLVELVENIDERDSEDLTVIQRLVVSKDEARLHRELFSRLIELGADYTCRDQNGDTVLHLAARNGHWEIVKYLVQLGEPTDTPDSEGFVILHRAVTADTGDSCAQDMLCSILKSNPELSKRTKHGEMAIHLAARYERWETVVILLEHGANVFDCDSENVSVLQQIIKCQSSFPLALPILQRTVVIHTAEHHYNLYNTLVCEAAKCSKWDLLQYLIDVCGVNIGKLALDGLSLLHIVAQTKFTQYPHQIISELVKRLLNKGMKLEDRCPNGNTPLHLAAKSDNWDLVKYLVEQGANIQSPDSEGLLVLQRLAMSSSYGENQREFLRLLIKKGADVKVRDSNGNSLLHLGGKANNWSFVLHIIQESTDLQPEELDNDGFNLLHRLALFDKL
ncbi:uncharacterized protein LOC112558723 [Pomacea canaliculata]|uniref:uncharacterized protein LOC112558723 n=1 Tax=Pomacea canaliculata TaxID=400727 RepID=UPI000D7312AD|nr:uncharacterized protein LOC112558723 [Pomacea canaliculata]